MNFWRENTFLPESTKTLCVRQLFEVNIYRDGVDVKSTWFVSLFKISVLGNSFSKVT